MTSFEPSSSQDAVTHQQLRRSLQQTQIFADMSTALIDSLVQTMSVSLICGGDQVFTQGEPSDSLLIVLSGRLLATLQLPDGSSKPLGEIGPGNSVGEIGLVLQQPRAASVIAVRDTSVGWLTRAQFEQLLISHPIEFNRAITRTLYEYSRQTTHRPVVFGATTLTIIPLTDGVKSAELSLDLVQALAKTFRVKHIDPATGQDFHVAEGASAHSNQYFNVLEQSFDYLIYEAAAQPCPWSNLAIRQADHVVLVVNADSDPQQLIASHPVFSCASFNRIRKSLVILHPSQAVKAKVHRQWSEVIDLERTYPIREKCQPSIARLSRLLTDRGIGLVLGGGGSRGLAHIGVLKALHEANIPIDMICGNSMGALIGAQYVNGTPIDDILAATLRFVRGGERPTIPLFSLLSGHRVKRDLKKMFAEQQIENLWRPFFAVSCNLSHATLNTHNQGPLWQAILASNSPAGILPPVIINGDLMVDAALLDNVPVRAMRQRIGFGTLIAVDVDVAEQLTVDPSIKILSGWRVLQQRLFYRDQPRLPGIIDLLIRSGHLGGLANRSLSISLADHYWQPPIAQFALMAYGKSEQIVEVGYQYAKQQLSQWADQTKA